MFVYSGKCRQCDCGIDTGFKDTYGKPLFTGDIVIAFVEDDNGVNFLGGLTVVVVDQYQTYSDGTHKVLSPRPTAFVMGIKDASWGDGDEWRVKKLKSYKNVIEGESWHDYGFSYKNI